MQHAGCKDPSRHLRTLGLTVNGVERLARRHEQAIPLGAAEAEVCARFWKMNLADQRAVRRENVHSVVSFSSPASSGPDVAVHIAANAIRGARRQVGKHPAIL